MRILLVAGADSTTFARELAGRLTSEDVLTVVAPVVRGGWVAGLMASPDLDALLAPTNAPTYAVTDALGSIDYVPHWQRASDAVIAVRLVRTELCATGASLTEATTAAAARSGLPYGLLPMCDGRAELRVVVDEPEPRAVHVEEYLADHNAHAPSQLLLVADQIAISSTVAEVLDDADVLILGPSSRTLVIDPVLRTPGFLDRVRDDLPVLVVDHGDTAPPDLVRVAGLRHDDPASAERIIADPVVVATRARELS